MCIQSLKSRRRRLIVAITKLSENEEEHWRKTQAAARRRAQKLVSDSDMRTWQAHLSGRGFLLDLMLIAPLNCKSSSALTAKDSSALASRDTRQSLDEW